MINLPSSRRNKMKRKNEKTEIENIIQNVLGIDWKIDRKQQTIENLEKLGGKSNKKLHVKDIKTYIMQLLKKSKEGKDPSNEEMSKIISNIEKMDHHDLVRTDQILTRKVNNDENEYQWGSLVMNCKWKRV